MGCWASREKYEVTREWGGQVGPSFIPEFHIIYPIKYLMTTNHSSNVFLKGVHHSIKIFKQCVKDIFLTLNNIGEGRDR